MADPEAFVALGDLLPFSNVADDHGAGKWRAQARLVQFDLEAMNFCLAAFNVCFPAIHFEPRGFGFEIGLFQVRLA